MSPDRLRRVEDLYHAALALAPEVRGAFVVEACGADESLRRELDSLLNYAGTDGFLGQPPGAAGPRLTSCQVLGHYEVLAPLGAGGMGEVYRARDTLLGREVAIKVLPFEVAGDPERLRRFEREARAAAALAHPNIVTIHSVEHEADVHFLTMELVEGAPLSERIPHGGFSIDRFLDLAIALADAVGAAHASGIVHRDLKPANVMVTPDGRVKVLDFGLAKLKPLVEGVDLASGPVSASLTGDGRLVGTVAYMSPEQAEGREVDHRSDTFSLGVLFYEIATGERPFKGDTSVALLSSILKDTPRPLSDVKPVCPSELSRILRRCLTKDPARRYQSAVDLRNDLDECRQELASGALTSAVEAVTARQRSTIRWASGLAVLVGVGVAGVFVGRGIATGEPHAAVRRLEVVTKDAQIIAPFGGREIALSPDGARLAYLDVDRMYVRRLADSFDAMVPAGESRSGIPVSPFFSPDGRRLAYSIGNRFLETVWVDGADKAQKLCDHSGVGGGTWTDDGTIIFSDGTSLWTTAIGKDCQRLGAGSTVNGGAGPAPTLRSPQVLPGGERLLVELEENKTRRAAIVSRRSGEILQAVEADAASPRYVSTGHLLFVRGTTLFAAPFDATAMKTTGSAFPLQKDVFVDGLAQFDVSNDGTLAYVAASANPQFRLVWVDRRTRGEQPIDLPAHDYWAPRLSPNGDRLAVVRSRSADRRFQIDLVDLTTGTPDFFADGVWPEWTPDGRDIAFTSYDWKIVRRPIGNRDAPETILSTTSPAMLPSFSKSGMLMSFQTAPVGAADQQMRVLRSDHAASAGEMVPAAKGIASAYLSPDARYVAYASDDESGSREVFVRTCKPCRPDANVPDGTWHVSVSGGRAPRWSADGNEIFYLQGAMMMSVRVRTDPTFSFDPPHVVFDALDYVVDRFGNRNYDVTRDGQRFVMVKRVNSDEGRHRIALVINWFEELRTKVPVGGK